MSSAFSPSARATAPLSDSTPPPPPLPAAPRSLLLLGAPHARSARVTRHDAQSSVLWACGIWGVYPGMPGLNMAPLGGPRTTGASGRGEVSLVIRATLESAA